MRLNAQQRQAVVESLAAGVPLVSTAKWGYLRLRRPGYDKKELKKWHEWIKEQKWKQAFVLFKHEDAGSGPKLAMEFLDLAQK